MAWFLRAVEKQDGHWVCQHGLQIFDGHDGLHDAIRHLRNLAATMRPAELIVHRLDGTIENLGPA